MTIARISQIEDISELARATGVSREQIETYAYSENQSSFYQVIYIPKRGKNRKGEYRVVFKSRSEWLSQLHRSLSMIVVNSVEYGEHVQGFRKNCSTRTNANLHLAAKELLHADIVSFFDVITVEQVEDGLRVIGCRERLVKLFAKICTIDGFLRQGTRCSPAVSNLVCRNLDVDMLLLAASSGCRYSRYADDITFSGDRCPDSESVKKILAKNHFELRDGRCYLQRKGSSQYVTGLTVADEVKPRVPRRLKRRLRLAIYYIEKFGVEAHFEHEAKAPVVKSPSELEGMLAFVYSVEPDLARKLYRKYISARN